MSPNSLIGFKRAPVILSEIPDIMWKYNLKNLFTKKSLYGQVNKIDD